MTLTRALPLSLFFLTLGFAPFSASAQVYKCVDVNGKISYTNERSSKSCETLNNTQSVSTISMRAPTSAPATFPKVSSDTQQERDRGRRQVLESELASEQAALEAARKQLAEQETVRYGNEKNYQKVLDRLQPFKDDIERRERNIEALNKELSGQR
ncbi:MAG: DUF4124 domain-containing protein [Azoarcus sp.]|jgi:septal ring factor EnvC (AmiA/AmiB activator)|nr:DUF4124 domain-containing protein [Azoarcus sp.]